MSEAIVLIPLDRLRESPTNPRKRYSDASLQEVADSIATQGVMQPIVVRECSQADLEYTHEIVFGHRRSRAARLAGLTEIPAIVRQMTDAEVALAQLHENLHREDVHPVEEAEAFATMMEEHNLTVERLVLDSGKSRSYIYARLKLATMAPEVRAACIEDGLGAEVALLVARLPHHKLQAQALKNIRLSDGWASYRHAKNILQQYTIKLDGAPFDLADASLPGGACAKCPKLACNDPDLADLSADTCTDKQCYGEKQQAQAGRVIALARECGRPVIEGEAAAQIARHPDWPLRGYERLDSFAFYREVDGKGVDVTWEEALAEMRGEARGMIKPAVIVIPGHEDRPIHALSDAAQQWILTALGQDEESDGGSTPSAAARAPVGATRQADDDEPEWSPAARVVRHAGAWAKVLRRVVFDTMRAPRTLGELRMLLHREIGMDDQLEIVGDVLGFDVEMATAQEQAAAGGQEFDRFDWITTRIERLDADSAGAMLVSIALVDWLSGGPWVGREAAERKAALVASLGIDVLAVASEAEPNRIDDAGPAGGRVASTPDLFEAAS